MQDATWGALSSFPGATEGRLKRNRSILLAWTKTRGEQNSPIPVIALCAIRREHQKEASEPRMTDSQVTHCGAVELAGTEELAVELATLAGREITAAFGTIFTVRYKTGPQDAVSLRDPVSEIDRKVEVMIRERLAASYPDHGVIGEELAERRGSNSDFVWAIDPIDGTTNFVNGFPLFAASIGLLYRGRPVVGAVWCSVSHALRAGVYHGSLGAKLRFEGTDVTPKVRAGVLRRLAGVPVVADADEAGWETRKTGSAALECALVASGLLEVARFESPNIWDVAAGIALIAAGGGSVQAYDGSGWAPLTGFAVTGGDQELHLRRRRLPIVVGTKDAVRRMCD
jgi:myo-inositol-1(or 4)-monophosphatase